MSNRSIDEKNILSVDRIEMSDTISQFMEKVNNNFSKIVESGGGPAGTKGDLGNQGVPTKPKVPIHVWKEGEECIENKINDQEFEITRCYEDLTNVKYQEGHIIMLQNGNVYTLEKDDSFNLKPKYVLTLQTYMPGEVVDGKKAFVHIAYADDDSGSGFVTESELSNGNYNPEPVTTYNLRRNARAGINVLDKKYMGIYTNHTETPSLDPERYNWIKIQGSDGKVGDMGVSSKIIMIYTSGKHETGEEFIPDKPIGGSYDFNNNEFVCPDGWFQTDSEAEPPIYMSSRTFTTSDLSTDKEWSKPVRITGEDGLPGADGSSIEYIFRLAYELTQKDLDALFYSPENENKYVPDPWKDSPEGIDENNTREWCSIRFKNPTTKKWGKWEKPTIWSQYGLNGQDGDGVQYIYYLTNTATPPKNPTPKGFTTNDSYQDRNTEWKPGVDSYENKDGITLTFTKEDNWSDNPKDISVDKQYQWMACRKYRLNDESKKMAWGAFSDPTLWSRFGEKGESGTFIRTMYTVSEGTSLENLPDLPKDSTGLGSQWSTEFPTDYIFGKNVVWGTTAELKAGTNEFVDETKGWSTPYIVTGTKGVGEQGPKGDPGPAGNPGFDGIPGASLNILYCLGNEEEPFGDKESWNQNRLKITGWFDILPNPNKIKLTDSNDKTESDILTPEYLSDNRGRVVYVKDITTEEYTHKHYYINENSELVDLQENNEDFVSYVWAIQGTDIWSRKNDEDEKTGIKWTAPFKLQGTNGIRGVAGADGNRGQVVYPMGVYNYETTYITTDEKAPYVFDNGNYYVLNIIGEWKGSDNANTTPSQNYNYAIENNIKPIWQKFEGFEAIFTKIGIIANGMVGSAVFNNEFMFSQQGINKDGNKTDYAIESGDDPSGNSGFLSGYVYDEKGKDGRHWKYVGTDDYIKDIDVNPYEEKDGTPIHSFRPNVCINFATGQMWLSNGKAVFGQEETNLATNQSVVDLSKDIEDITNDIASISSEATDVTNSLNDLNEVLSKSLEDGYLSKDEQVRIYSKLSDLIVQFNELEDEHEDLLNNTFLKVDNNTKEEFKDKIIKVRDNLNTSFRNLYVSHNMYKHEINTLLGISFETPSTYNLKGGVTNKKFPKINIYEALGKNWSYKYKKIDAAGNFIDAEWNWEDKIPNDKGEIPGFIDFQIKYENDLNNYLAQVLATEKFIEEQFNITIEDNISTQNNLLRDEFEDKLAKFNDERLEDLAEQITNINGGLEELQKQVDGEVSSYFEPFAPVIIEKIDDGGKIYEYDSVILDVEPLKSWLENYTKNESGYYELNSDSDSDSKDELFNNLGDTFTNTQKYIDAEQTPLAGKSWRWCDATSAINANQITKDGCILVKRGEENRYLHWHRITDTDALRALQMAAEAQATADKKCTVYISTEIEGDRFPDNYNIGDLWILNENAFKFGGFNVETIDGEKKYKTSDGEVITVGDILNANEASITYNVNHWSKQVKYTDDTAAEVAQQKADDAYKAAENAKKNAEIAKAQLDAIDDDSVISKTEFATLETQLEQIEKDHLKIVSDSELYSVDLNKSLSIKIDEKEFSNSYNTSYENAVSALKYHCGKPYDEDGNIAEFNYLKDKDGNDIVDENNKKIGISITIENSNLPYSYNNIALYYEFKQVILEEITKAAREYAESYANDAAKEALDNYETDGINLISARVDAWENVAPKNSATTGNLFENVYVSSSNIGVSLKEPLYVSGNIYINVQNKNFYANILQFDSDKKYLGIKYNILYIESKAITLNENTKYIGVSVVNKNYTEVLPEAIKDVRIKIEKGDKPTAYTLAPEDVNAEVLEAQQAVSSLNESLTDTEELLNKSLEDGFIDNNEKEALRKSIDQIETEYNSLVFEYNDVYGSSYLSKPTKTNLEGLLSNLNTCKNEYINNINAIININSRISVFTPKIDIASKISNWTFEDNYNKPKTIFYNAISAIRTKLIAAQEEIRAAMANEAQQFTKAAVNDIVVGGKNLLYKTDIGRGYSSSTVNREEVEVDEWKATDAIKYTTSGGNSILKVLFSYDRIPYEGNITPYCFSGYIKNNGDANISILIKLSPNKEETTINNVYRLTLQPQESKKILLQGRYLVNQILQVQINGTNITDEISFVVWHWKLEEGNMATDWTPAPEDIDSEIKEAKDAALEVSGKLTDTESLLNKSLEDGYIDANEKEALNKALDALNAEFNDIKKEYEDVCNYLTSAQKKALEDVYKDLETKHTKYVSVINAITNIKIEGLTLVKPKIQIPGWDASKYKDPKSEYKSALTAYLSALSTAQTQMRENLDAETKKNINEAIDSIHVGGINYASLQNAKKKGFSFYPYVHDGESGFWKYHMPTLWSEVGENYNIDILGLTYNTNTQYTISVKGMCLTDYPDSEKYGSGITIRYTDGTADKRICSFYGNKMTSGVLISEKGKTIQNLYFNYQYGYTYIFKIQVEKGNVATEWKPNEDDIIEARENILKGGMMLDYSVDTSKNNETSFYPESDTAHYTENGKYLLTSELKPDTEYVFSIEQIVLKNTSTKTPDKISFCITNTGSDLVTKYYHMPYVEKKLIYTFITPSILNSGYYLRLYVGKQGSTDGVALTYYGIKLAEGNKYTHWDGTADEQKTLIMLNNALNGSTETNGGLMLTNTIGMKGSSTDSNSITAGINGLNSSVSGMSSDLRFWAGSTNWSDINTSPFRVYNNGDVYGGSFYGFNNAFKIKDDTIFNVCTYNVENWSANSGSHFTINVNLTGENIYIDRITDNAKSPEGSYILGKPYFNLPTTTNYVGATIKIYNPCKYMINATTSKIAHPNYCNLDNYNNTILSTEVSNFSDGIIQSTTSDGKYCYRWSVITSFAVSLAPLYCEFKCMPILVPSGTKIPTKLTAYKISGNINTDNTTTSECVFMRWILLKQIK